ncbi:MAG: TonB-dependent receptor [Candidatus Cloacimonetes bacterium]|nr:TonB-dependent receptor [Candidatus Cloacimonadota bacterium]
MKKLIQILLMLVFYTLLSAASVNGFITDKSNGEKIPYATVILQGTNLGAHTNAQGYFVINNIPVGNYEIVFLHIGFEKHLETVEIKETTDNKFFRIELGKVSIEMQGIEVVAEKFTETEINPRIISVAKLNLQAEAIKEIPEVGEADVLRAVQTLPGVASISDYSSGLFIRGGSADQNLILLDDIDVYNPNHVGGIFSTFNSDAIANVELIKGGYPVNYGGRLSSVLNVSNLDGNRKKHEGVFRFSFLATSATLQGPWKLGGQSGSYMISFRRTYFDLLKKAAEKSEEDNEESTEGIPDYYFYDGHMKINWDVSERDKVSLSYYAGRDVLNEEEDDNDSKLKLLWGNNTLSFRWTHVFSAKLFSRTILAGSSFVSDFDYDNNSNMTYDRRNTVNDYSVKQELEYYPVDTHRMKTGIEFKSLKMKYKSLYTGDFDQNMFPNTNISTLLAAFYLEDSWKLSETWTFQPGLRMNYAKVQSTYLRDKPETDFFNPEFRASLRKEINENSNVYFSYGRFHQYLNTMNVGFAPLDVWFPLDKSLKPGVSDHFILGYRTMLGLNHVLELEAYYKDMDNLVEFRSESYDDWQNDSSMLCDMFNKGKGFSYGVDLLLRTNWKGIEGFLSYGFGITRKKTDTMNTDPADGSEQYYYPKYDRTHSFNLVETYNLTQQTGFRLFGSEVKLGITNKFATGQPYQKPERIYIDDNAEIFYSYMDRVRLPAYSRTDLSFKTKWYKKKYTIESYLQIINVFARENVDFIEYLPAVDDEGRTFFKKNKSDMLPFLPFMGINIEW